MIMFKFFYNIEDEQPAYYLQTNPQNPNVKFDDFWILDIALKLQCHRIDKITNAQDYLKWWVYE